MIKSQIQTKLPNISLCNGNVIIPIVVTNCDSIGSISLALQFDTNTLIYSGYQQINPLLQGMIINKANNKIYLSWASINNTNIGNDTLVKMEFVFIADTSNINWDTLSSGNCEYSNSQGNIIQSFFTGDTIISAFLSPNLISPVNNTTEVSNIINFNWEANNCTNSFKYQLSNDSSFNYLIIDTILTNSNIKINNLLNISTYYWRVAAIDTLNTFKWSQKRSFYYALSTGINNNKQNELISNSLFIYPNPCKGNYCYINDNINIDNVKEIRIFNSQGSLIKSFLCKYINSNSVEMINVSELTNGIYYVIYKYYINSNIYYNSTKLIIEK